MYYRTHTAVQRVWLKHKLMLRGDPRHELIRPVIFFCGGGMKGIFGIGAARALEMLGLTDVFVGVGGGSCGASNALYFVAHQTEIAASVYLKHLTDHRFASRWRILKILNLEYLIHVLRNVKRLNVERVRRSQAQIFVTVTCPKTGRGRLLDAKTETDVFHALKASMAVPGFYNHTVLVNGRPYIDGQVAAPLLPLNKVIRKTNATDVLVVMNQPMNFNLEVAWWQRPLINVVYAGAPGIRRGLLHMDAAKIRSMLQLDEIINSDDPYMAVGNRRVNVGVICPDAHDVRLATIDHKALQGLYKHGEEVTHKIFKK